MNVSIHADTPGMIAICIVLAFSVVGYSYVWSRIDNASIRMWNFYDLCRSATNRPLRVVATIFAVLTWPIWSLMTIVMVIISYTVMMVISYVNVAIRICRGRR